MDSGRYKEEEKQDQEEEIKEDTDKEKKKKVRTSKKKKAGREKELEKVPVRGSVQMWLVPGQGEVLEDWKKAIEQMKTEGKEMSNEELEACIPKVKSYAVFMAEGSGEMRYLFPKVYQDILTTLPYDIVAIDDDFEDNDEK